MFRRVSVVGLFLLLGCKAGPLPAGVIPEDRFADIYVALLERTTTGDSTADSSAAIRGVLSSMKVTEDQYRATVRYYSGDVERWREFYARVIRRLEARRKNEMGAPE